MTSADEKFMNELCKRVNESLLNPSPNPKVGCLIVKDGREIGFGIHEKAGGPHAEVIACRAPGEDLEGATVYVTLEPCAHYGKTPPCTALLISKKVSRVIYAISDPTDAGGGALKLSEAGIEVVAGVGEEAATSTLAPWLHFTKTKLPFVRLKFAKTKDGFIARTDGSSKWISNDESRKLVHHLRAQSDAVLVGTKTAIVDLPKLDARIPEVAKQPQAYVMGLSDVQDFMPHAKWLQTRDPVVALHEMAAANIQSVLVEGGSEVAAAFLKANLVDEIWEFESPVKFGNGISAPDFDKKDWKVQFQQRIGGDILTVYARP